MSQFASSLPGLPSEPWNRPALQTSCIAHWSDRAGDYPFLTDAESMKDYETQLYHRSGAVIEPGLEFWIGEHIREESEAIYQGLFG